VLLPFAPASLNGFDGGDSQAFYPPWEVIKQYLSAHPMPPLETVTFFFNIFPAIPDAPRHSLF